MILYVAKEWTSGGTKAGKPEQARQAHLGYSGIRSEHRILLLLSTRRIQSHNNACYKHLNAI